MKYLIALLTSLSLLLGTMYHLETQGHNKTILTLAALKTQHAKLETSSIALTLQHSNKIRELESDLLAQRILHKKEVDDTKAKAEAARTKYISGTAGMRRDTEALVARARKECVDPATAGVRETTSDPIGVLAYVLGRLDRRTEVLADVATKRGIAGTACEVEFENLRQKLNKE